MLNGDKQVSHLLYSVFYELLLALIWTTE